jgi:hypothetical protein
MRLLLVGACVVLVSGCESMNQKVGQSRQDRCQRANWSEVGERDGATSGAAAQLSERYAYICGDMYDDAAYKAGFSKGAARRPKPQGD